jgi:transcription elongation factor Elf1
MMTKLLEKALINLNCPNCNKEISDAWICKLESIIGTRYAYICSNCQKLIRISTKKISGYQTNLTRAGESGTITQT